MPRLLLVEDAPDVALVVERLGRRMGLEVLHRADVGSAWECVRETAPDLILLDLNLTGERGEELCRRLRAAPVRVPVALFVHLGCVEDVVSGLEAGADFLVSKDLLGRPEEWQARVREILAARDGLDGAVSLSCQRNDLLPQPSTEAVAALNRALRHPLLRQLGSDVVRLVLRRAAGIDGGHWLEPDGLALDARQVAASAAPGAVRAFAAAVTEQMHRLLGSAAAPAGEALAAALADRADDPPEAYESRSRDPAGGR